MTKSRSTHHLILPTTVISTFTTQHSKLSSSRRGTAPYYKQLETNKTKQSDPISNDRPMAIINHLFDNLHQRLNKLENLHSTVSENSYKRDLMIKQSIEQIFTDLHIRVTNEHQQKNFTPTVVND